MTDATAERLKYEKAWNHVDYRIYSPGEEIAVHYVTQCRPKVGRLIDFGTGTGRAALILHNLGFDVTMIDIASNCLDYEVQDEIGHRLMIANLWEPLDIPKAQEGFCTDVMEHIPPERVDAVIENILKMTCRAFFHICLREDHFGKQMDEHLHLTVKPFTWWRDKLAEHGSVNDARDLIDNGWFYVS